MKLPLASIPVVEYENLFDGAGRCLAYFFSPVSGGYDAFYVSDEKVWRYFYPESRPVLPALSSVHAHAHLFECELWEEHGVEWAAHPRLHTVRKPGARDFFFVEGEGLHEVGVGPVHAGIIEPGHFRFSCSGEKVLHLEIALGYQRRGVEKLMRDARHPARLTTLAESICGDTAIGHAWAACELWEKAAGWEVAYNDLAARAMALEIERMGQHLGNLSALCTDLAYRPGASVFGVLRTPVVNFMQSWCGNRFGKGLLRPGGVRFPFTEALKSALHKTLDGVEKKFRPMAAEFRESNGVAERLQGNGRVTREQAEILGWVGLCAKTCGVPRDARTRNPLFPRFVPITLPDGDAYARAVLRLLEIEQSVSLIRTILDETPWPSESQCQSYPAASALEPQTLVFSVVEAWRGEVVHAAVTDEQGRFKTYKIVDPSFHNWKALELSMRGTEIADFPINNKSYDLSYCGFDL